MMTKEVVLFSAIIAFTNACYGKKTTINDTIKNLFLFFDFRF